MENVFINIFPFILAAAFVGASFLGGRFFSARTRAIFGMVFAGYFSLMVFIDADSRYLYLFMVIISLASAARLFSEEMRGLPPR
ncbi:MAG: hypothetical protein ACK4S4_07275 [Pyrinomonadaceae bacterium]